MGEKERALEAARRAVELASGFSLPAYVLGFALAANGLTDEARALAASLEAQSRITYVLPYFIGLAHVAAGNTEAAFEYLGLAVEEKSPWVMWLATEPKLDVIRDDPRFLTLLYKSGHLPAPAAEE